MNIVELYLGGGERVEIIFNQVTICYFFFTPLVVKPHTGRDHVFLKSVLTEELHLGIVHMGNAWDIIKAWDNNLHGVWMF